MNQLPQVNSHHRKILDELLNLELFFHNPPAGTRVTDLESLVDPGFWETGASGKQYDREFVLSVLAERTVQPLSEVWTAKDAWCRPITEDTYLLTYSLEQGSRFTRRSSIWKRNGERWMCMYHQGTIVADV
jgi:hypothetical protein